MVQSIDPMKFGPHTQLVNEVVDYARHGELLDGIGPLPSQNIVAIHELDRAHELEYYEPPEYDDVEHFLIWKAIIQNEEAAFFCLTQKEVSYFKREYHDKMSKLTDEITDIVRSRLPSKYSAKDHGDYEVIGWHLGSIAYHRAAFGIKENSFFERMFDLYKTGGYPCGWEGVYPEGRFIVYYPSAEELANRS